MRASNTFPGDRHLIELWSPNSQKLHKQKPHDNLFDAKYENNAIYYEDITFRDILFDSSYKGGGLFVTDSARIRINNCFFLHFFTQGILVERGHETFISGCFLGQHPTIGGDRGEKDFSGTAIELASTDNAVTDVAIFSAEIGIIIRGRANIITGVHCYNKATSFGGIGILVKSAQTRIENCYIDYNTIVLEDPNQVVISNGYFLGDGNIVLRSINGGISGVNIVNNIFCGDASKMVPIVKLDGEFVEIDQVLIENNIVNGMRLKSTVAKLTVAGNGTKWEADFSSVLVFPGKINHVFYSFYRRIVGSSVNNNTSNINLVGFGGHFVSNVSNNVVVVESEEAFDGVLSVFVDQYSIGGEKNLFM